MLKLIKPNAAWEEQFMALVADYAQAREHRYQLAQQDFPVYVRLLLADEHVVNLQGERVPQTTLWLVDETEIIGISRLRHYLTPRLEQIGGHIGYDIRPSKRRQGYGSQLLALTLPFAQALGLKRVLVTCDVENTASARIIEKNGGQLSSCSMVEGQPRLIARYWIDLESASELEPSFE